MNLWPLKVFHISTPLSGEDIIQVMNDNTDQDYKSIYWGKRFYKHFFGSVGKRAFKVRPVVPYWNISPVEIRGRITESENQASQVQCRLVCPYLRFVVPLVVLVLLLFLLNYGVAGEPGIFFNALWMILLGAYLLVNVPFQIQASGSIKELAEKLDGEVIWDR